MDYNGIKRNYDRGLWTKAMIKVCVKKGLITTDQYQSITAEVYVA